MKKFRADGLHDNETMTVGELRKSLELYPNDMPVVAVWEGVSAPINSKNFEIKDTDAHDGFYCERTLEIDVESY